MGVLRGGRGRRGAGVVCGGELLREGNLLRAGRLRCRGDG